MDIRKIQQKNEKSWILKTDYGEHLLNFSDFLKFSHRFNCLKNTSSCSSLVSKNGINMLGLGEVQHISKYITKCTEVLIILYGKLCT